MGKRLGLGLLIGVLVGGLFGFGLFQIFPTAMAGGLGYLFAAVVGILVGLVAGKPIWRKGAAVEAGLKAGIGAALACGLLFGIRYLGVDIPAMGPITHAKLGYHSLASLVTVSTLLALFYEIDNSGDEDEVSKHAPTRKRVDEAPKSSRAKLPEAEDEDEAPVSKKKKA